MAHAIGWKLATAGLSVAVLALSTTLVLRPEPQVRVETVVIEREPTDAPDAEQESAPERDRRHVSAKPGRSDVVAVPTRPDVDPRLEPERERLARMSVDEVCRTELLAGGRAPAELVVERLLLDRDRATELMTRWNAKRDDPRWAELGITLAPHFDTTFLAVAGDTAVAPLRERWRSTRDTALTIALIRHGDVDTLRTIDEDHRSPHPRRRENPYMLVTLGDPAREMVWGWIEDPRVEKSVRTTAIGGMWASGTDADRQRLWAEMDDTVRVTHFAPHTIRDENDWSGRLRRRVEAMLVDPDHWVRLHAARAALQNSFEWGNDLARRAADIATEDARLPKPGGRDQHEWNELLRWIEIHRAQLPATTRDDEAVREALGLE